MDLAYHPVVRGVASALKDRCGVKAGERVLVGVSGGADSVALLLAMVFLAKRRGRGMEIAVGHVQHHLRACAEGDAVFVEALAKRLGVPFFRTDLDLKSGAGASDSKVRVKRGGEGNLEARARTARYDALLAMARGFGARHVVVAHHADDQMETLLLNLARGAGMRGLGGMPWKRRLARGEDVWLVRPLLGVGREDVMDFLTLIQQQYRTDPTNADVTRARARLRADVLPVLKAIHGRAAQNASLGADRVREAHRALVRQGVKVFDGDDVERAALRETPEAVLAVGLKKWLGARGVESDRVGSKVLGSMVKAIKDGKGGVRRFELSGGRGVEVTRERVRFQNRE